MDSDDVTGKQNLPETLHSAPEKAVTPSADAVEKFTETVGEAMAKYSDKIMLRSSESEENNADGTNVILTLLQKLENSFDSFKEGPETMLTKYHDYFFDSETYLFTGQIKEIPLAHSAGISIETMKKDAPECSKKTTSRSPESEKENNNGGGGEAGKTNKTVKFPSIETSRSDVFPKLQALKTSPSVGVNLESYEASNTSPGMKSTAANQVISESGAVGNGGGSLMVDEAWECLKKSYVFFNGNLVGTLAALDPSVEALNYNQVFVRDFVPSGLACLMKEPPEPEIVKNFLLKTLHLQGREKRIDNFTLGEGVMPASFKVLYDSHRAKDTLLADFGGSAIGRVAPVDSGFWWIILLRSYTKCTRDHSLCELPEVQKGIKLILNLCLSDGFDTFPTLLCADGCSMIDRRMFCCGC